MLSYLGKNAADALQPEYAHTLTMSIYTEGKYRSWKEALAFCYWMRSQGFDTYAQLKTSAKQKKDNENAAAHVEPDSEKDTIIIKLFIADPATHNRAADKLYWEQNTKTGAIKSFSFVRSRGPRRNALAVRDPRMPSVMPPLQGGFISRGTVQQEVEVAEEEEGEEEEEIEQSEAAVTRQRLLTERVAAQEQLETMLATSDPNEAYVFLTSFLSVQCPDAGLDTLTNHPSGFSLSSSSASKSCRSRPTDHRLTVFTQIPLCSGVRAGFANCHTTGFLAGQGSQICAVWTPETCVV
jgi:hypothetical protein